MICLSDVYGTCSVYTVSSLLCLKVHDHHCLFAQMGIVQLRHHTDIQIEISNPIINFHFRGLHRVLGMVS